MKEVKEIIEFMSETDECNGFCKLLSKVDDTLDNVGYNRYAVTKSQIKKLIDEKICFRIVFEK